MSAETAKELNGLSNRIIGLAIDIHKKLNPGFQEKIYEEALLKAASTDLRNEQENQINQKNTRL